MSRYRPSRPWPRALALAPIAGLALALAACSSGGASSSGSSPAANSGKHFTIAYVPGATGVSFYDTLVARACAPRPGSSA